jgi:hypothetical protein
MLTLTHGFLVMGDSTLLLSTIYFPTFVFHFLLLDEIEMNAYSAQWKNKVTKQKFV